MPTYLLSVALWKAIWPVPIMAALIAFISHLLGRAKTGQRSIFLILLSFSMLGLVTGILTGFSRQSAIGAVLPAVLTLIGGFSIYLIEKSTTNREFVSLIVFSLSFSLFIGVGWGAILREEADEYKKSTSYLVKKALIELEIQEVRTNLGLPKESKNQEPIQIKIGD